MMSLPPAGCKRFVCRLRGHTWLVPGAFLRNTIGGYLEIQACERCHRHEIVLVV